jgi:hypothetical protein
MALAFALAVSASRCEAAHRFCDQCGCRQHCKKVCRLVCGKKKEIKIEYSCECEDFCVPGRSVKCGEKCECNRLGIKCCHAVLKPVCAEVRTKRVLVKKEVEKEVPDYKWVVEEVCCHCGQAVKADDAPAAGKSPAMVMAPPAAGGDESPEIAQVSAEEELERLPPVDAEEAIASDGDQGVVETPKRRGLLHALFGQ